MPFVQLFTRNDLLVLRRDHVEALQSNRNKSSTPEINGSPAGFLALVISLSVFVILCCIAIFWLLAYHQPTEEERRKRKAELDAAKLASTKQSPQSLDPRSWRARIGRAFGRKGQWVQAADDEEEFESADAWRGEQELRDRSTSGGERGMVSSRGMTGGPSHSSSTSTVELSVPYRGSRPTTPGAVYFPTYDEPFTRTVASPGPSILSPTPSCEEHVHGRLHSMSAEVLYEGSMQDDRSFSVQSFNLDGGQVSMRKWDNGTKFQEVIQ